MFLPVYESIFKEVNRGGEIKDKIVNDGTIRRKGSLCDTKGPMSPGQSSSCNMGGPQADAHADQRRSVHPRPTGCLREFNVYHLVWGP